MTYLALFVSWPQSVFFSLWPADIEMHAVHLKGEQARRGKISRARRTLKNLSFNLLIPPPHPPAPGEETDVQTGPSLFCYEVSHGNFKITGMY